MSPAPQLPRRTPTDRPPTPVDSRLACWATCLGCQKPYPFTDAAPLYCPACAPEPRRPSR